MWKVGDAYGPGKQLAVADVCLLRIGQNAPHPPLTPTPHGVASVSSQQKRKTRVIGVYLQFFWSQRFVASSLRTWQRPNFGARFRKGFSRSSVRSHRLFPSPISCGGIRLSPATVQPSRPPTSFSNPFHPSSHGEILCVPPL